LTGDLSRELYTSLFLFFEYCSRQHLQVAKKRFFFWVHFFLGSLPLIKFAAAAAAAAQLDPKLPIAVD
jgi:4-hydroxybenzoate polyprenyltransferase